jgi:hypothetical protein
MAQCEECRDYEKQCEQKTLSEAGDMSLGISNFREDLDGILRRRASGDAAIPDDNVMELMRTLDCLRNDVRVLLTNLHAERAATQQRIRCESGELRCT